MPIRFVAKRHCLRIAHAIRFPLLFAAYLSTLGACATAQQLHPCIESSPAIRPADPCADVPRAACAARMDYVRRMYASTVRIHVSSYAASEGMSYHAGTGAVIDDRGTVLTAYHVVQNARLVIVGARRLSDDGRSTVNLRDIPMRVAATAPALDVALLVPDGEGERLPTPLVVRRDAPAAGERLWHFGHVSFWSHGRVEETGVTYDGTAGLTRVDFPCRHGDSGGPFVDAEGRLVGVLLKKDGAEEGAGRTYYLPVGAALDALGYR
ncbi:MAG TPA: serine protease [Patescibacteria group bacterium]|nr:serine protease [Patescibacteria group bacterium]